MLQNLEDGPKNSKSRKSHNNLLIESSVDCSASGDQFTNKRELTSIPVTRSKKEASLVPGMGLAATGASGKFLAISSRQLLNRAFNKFLHKPHKSLGGGDTSLIDDASLAGGSTCHSSAALFPVNHLTGASSEARDAVSEDNRSEFPEHVLKVFKADQTCKYLLIHKETTAHEVVMLSLHIVYREVKETSGQRLYMSESLSSSRQSSSLPQLPLTSSTAPWTRYCS